MHEGKRIGAIPTFFYNIHFSCRVLNSVILHFPGSTLLTCNESSVAWALLWMRSRRMHSDCSMCMSAASHLSAACCSVCIVTLTHLTFHLSRSPVALSTSCMLVERYSHPVIPTYPLTLFVTQSEEMHCRVHQNISVCISILITWHNNELHFYSSRIKFSKFLRHHYHYYYYYWWLFRWTPFIEKKKRIPNVQQHSFWVQMSKFSKENRYKLFYN